MNQKRIFKLFFKYVSFNVLGMVGISAYILADTFFIAKGMGGQGLASLNFALPVFSLIFAMGLMIGIGGATKYAILRAQGNYGEANKIFSTALIFALTVGITFAIIGGSFSQKISCLLGACESTLEMTSIYLKTVMLFAPFFIVNSLIFSFVRNDGGPGLAMAAMLTGSISNIFLDYILIIHLNMGMFGAAFATGLSPVISILVYSKFFIKRENKFKFIKCKIALKRAKEIFSLGISAFITEISLGLVIIVFNKIIFSLAGNTGVAAYGIILNLTLVSTAVFSGISQGVQPIISTSYGKGDILTMMNILKYALISVIAFAVFLYLGVFAFTGPIVSIFNKDNDWQLAKIAFDGLRLYFSAFIFVGINIVAASFFSAVELPFKSFLISILRGGLIIIPLVFLLSHLLGVAGVWLSYPFGEFITFVFALYCLLKTRKNLVLKAN